MTGKCFESVQYRGADMTTQLTQSWTRTCRPCLECDKNTISVFQARGRGFLGEIIGSCIGVIVFCLSINAYWLYWMMSFLWVDWDTHVTYFNHCISLPSLHQAPRFTLLGGISMCTMYFDHVHAPCYLPLHCLSLPFLPSLSSNNSPSTFMSSLLDVKKMTLGKTGDICPSKSSLLCSISWSPANGEIWRSSYCNKIYIWMVFCIIPHKLVQHYVWWWTL